MGTATMSKREEICADGALTLEAAIEFTGLSRSTLYELMGSADLPYTRVGGRRLIPKRALVEMLAKGIAGVAGE